MSNLDQNSPLINSDPIPVVEQDGNRIPISPEIVRILTNQIQNQLTINHESFSGPIPHPKILADYNDVVPGAAERILADFEAQSKSRMANEKNVIDAEISKTRRGQWFAFFLATAVLAGAFTLLIMGKTIEGFGSILIGIAAVAGAFIYGKALENKKD